MAHYTIVRLKRLYQAGGRSHMFHFQKCNTTTCLHKQQKVNKSAGGEQHLTDSYASFL